ncbi:SMC family ATPase [Kineosporia sp. NBRC 101731]|uniref:AAA family ATPase n=1 Tax=Kineosporia sp. NBRC 101731 TaxID=3032199 RepID=UPI0024A2073C|nr:SMC family ATPase [Kineosporia sp. NBRC 101731]GLY31557.1 nuclease SbcCD subunit C [Kineosporia sp. NBRC 101731]
MRPVLLEMEGFASFRERALVDFEEADYFAIVGPTGSGKSTIVDAMTFALFGSAPRWGRKNAVSMALSPHGNRAVVRLVFELAGHRYVVAREVRRTGASISAKNQRLERLPSLESRGDPDENTVSIAADSKVTEAVEKLLGLTFEQFRQCVVLPQNAFAEFLHSTPKDRQEILLRLIGAEHYELIRGEANQRAQSARDRVEHLDRQLTELGDATAEAETAAAAREQQVSGLVDQVRAALPGLAAAQDALTEALRTQERLGLERDRLAAIVVPDGVSQIDRAVSEASAAASIASAAEATAEAADTAAREQLSAAPARGPLERTVKDRTELGALTVELPSLSGAQAQAHDQHVAAGHLVTAAELQYLQAQTASERAARTADEAGRRVRDLEAQHQLLTRPSLPSGLDELDRDLTSAGTALESATAELAEAEKADEAATAAIEAGPPRVPLERAQVTLEELATLGGRLAELEAHAEKAREAAQQASAAVDQGVAAVREARQRRDEAQLRHAASTLRGHLVAGEDCPVCAQNVAVVPRVVSASIETPAKVDTVGPGARAAGHPGLAAADAELAAADALIVSAEGALEKARARWNTAARAESSAQSQVETAKRRMEELRVNVPRACPDLLTAQRLLGELEALEARQRESGRLVRQARARADGARRQAEQLAAAQARIRGELGRARDPLVAMGAPAVEALSLVEAWHRLIDWASERSGVLATELAAARFDLERAEAERQSTGKELEAGEAELRKARTAESNVLARAERIRERVRQAEQRIARLTADLVDAPAEDSAREQIRQIDALEVAARQTDAALRSARQGREQAQRKLRDLDGRLGEGWAGLRRARDEVVQLGAPELTSEGLLEAWTGLTAWSSAAADARETELTGASEATSIRREQVGALRGELMGVLQQHAIPVTGDDLATTAPAAVAGAHAEARAALERIRERRAQAAAVVGERETQDQNAHVAKMLGDLLRTDKFPRWLATAALESLVIEASDTLLRLSNGQFDLDHDDKGDLVVVDHTDADARRSVKTLSGGETFQASLAMALALSSQMSQLSSAGGARLDSIFLDEGFGTLDPDTLETVAGTLENLARGERMVGVITHVPALADRVPVRFNVRRDAQTSRVERQNL